MYRALRRHYTQVHKDRLKRINDVEHYVPSGCYFNGTYYKRYWRGQRSKYIKRQCNRHFRRSTKECYNRGLYRKVTEFWYEYD